MKKILQIAPFVLIIYLVLNYHDTGLFQGAMKFLFNPGPDLAPPLFWQNYRILIMGGLLLSLVFFYRPVWTSCRTLIAVYQSSPVNNQKPPLSAQQANFLYLRDQTSSFMLWLIELCQMGICTLQYKKGDYYPWTIKRERATEKLPPYDQHLLTVLFADSDSQPLRPLMSDANPQIAEVSGKLFRQIKADTGHYSQPRRSNLVIWILFVIFIFEIPFYNALFPNHPGMIIIALFSAALFALPFYIFARQMPVLFSGSWRANSMLAVSVLFSLVGQMIIFSWRNISFFTIALFPGLAMALALIISNLPYFLKDSRLLSRIIGYKKYLNLEGVPFTEEELPWTLGLDVHTDITGPFHYGGGSIPEWLHSSEKDVQFLMKTLHKTLYQSVNNAIYGEMKSQRSDTGSRVMNRI